MSDSPAKNTSFPSFFRIAGLLFWTLLLMGMDQFSKMWATEHLLGRPPTTYLAVFQLTYAQNMGGWGSLGAQWNQTARDLALLYFPALLLIAMALYALRYTMPWPKAYGIAVLVAGGLGNLLDRLRFGHVIDFMYIGYGRIGTNIFNIADMAILVGVGLLLYSSWTEEAAIQDKDKGEPPLEDVANPASISP